MTVLRGNSGNNFHRSLHFFVRVWKERKEKRQANLTAARWNVPTQSALYDLNRVFALRICHPFLERREEKRKRMQASHLRSFYLLASSSFLFFDGSLHSTWTEEKEERRITFLSSCLSFWSCVRRCLETHFLNERGSTWYFSTAECHISMKFEGARLQKFMRDASEHGGQA